MVAGVDYWLSAWVKEDTYQDGYNRGFLAGLHNQR
jgi:hypothetical protein